MYPMEDVPHHIPLEARRGRGGVSNRSGRFEVARREAFDDGWDTVERADPLRTEVLADASRSVITRNQSPDVPFDRSINPYRGCEHGCAYCFARPSHAYLGLSPGLDFESRLFAKHDAPALLRRELARPGYICRPIALGVNTDAYQPVERRLEITRRILKELAAARHPTVLITKSNLVERDLDLLSDMAAQGLVEVRLSITTLDRGLARAMEPRAPTPGRRLRAVERLAAAGVPVGVMAAPTILGLNDSELEAILEAAAAAGARFAGYILLRLPRELGPLWDEWLQVHFPARRRKVLSLIAQSRSGRMNDPRFHHRMRGAGPLADLVARRFRLACLRLGLADQGPELCQDGFRPLHPTGQLDLFSMPCQKYSSEHNKK